jgi:hypothetical protein
MGFKYRLNDSRRTRVESLQEVTGENTIAGALDRAVAEYVHLAGEKKNQSGALEKLMKRAVEQGSVTPAEIATILDSDELPVRHQSEWSVGEE